jgi:hypothetical protein
MFESLIFFSLPSYLLGDLDRDLLALFLGHVMALFPGHLHGHLHGHALAALLGHLPQTTFYKLFLICDW